LKFNQFKDEIMDLPVVQVKHKPVGNNEEQLVYVMQEPEAQFELILPAFENQNNEQFVDSVIVQVKQEPVSDDEEDVHQQQQQSVFIKHEPEAQFELTLPADENEHEPPSITEASIDEEPEVDMKIAQQEEFPFKCDFMNCKYVTKTKQNFQIHQASHTKPFKCSECDERFSRNYLLKNHRLIAHENPNAFQCKVCGNQLKSSHSLKSHSKTHEPKPFKCSECLSSFRTELSLKNHQIVHSGSNNHVMQLNFYDLFFLCRRNFQM